ncbi:unnamed protein product [Prorocentrum cordatum]|uniref:Uncharacterized protein n=1 Tax=Prorocentrum cordatum TaxID=2364126 RepID=A0ABN9XRG3_9DINO|nr:unnamed protein product [Polarella glacialis]
MPPLLRLLRCWVAIASCIQAFAASDLPRGGRRRGWRLHADAAHSFQPEISRDVRSVLEALRRDRDDARAAPRPAVPRALPWIAYVSPRFVLVSVHLGSLVGHRGWATTGAAIPHINAHLSGQLRGEVPEEWLQANRRTHCRVCGLCVSTLRGGIHPTCRPLERQQARAQPPGAPPAQAAPPGMPTLAEIRSRAVPTLKHVPKECRGAWAPALTRCLAQVVHTNSVEAWTELQMLTKCLLAAPPRRGRAHARAVAAFTADRLARWEHGERAELWADLAEPQRWKLDNSTEARQRRADALAREGLDRKAVAALMSEPLVDPTAEARRKLEALHPTEPPPPPGPPAGLPPALRLTSDQVAEALKSFPEGSGAGPSALRAQHLRDALTRAHGSTLTELLTEVVQMLADGRAPGQSELIVPSGTLSAEPAARFPPALLRDEETGESRVNWSGDFELLGAPIGGLLLPESPRKLRPNYLF